LGGISISYDFFVFSRIFSLTAYGQPAISGHTPQMGQHFGASPFSTTVLSPSGRRRWGVDSRNVFKQIFGIYKLRYLLQRNSVNRKKN
jgi:hypothetical protein